MNPYAMLGGALALILALGGAYGFGRHDGAAIVRGGELKAAVAEAKLEDVKQDKIDASAGEHQVQEQTRQDGVREIYHETQKLVDRPVYLNQCVDTDGVRLLERAAAVANGEGGPVAPGGAAPAAGAAVGPDGAGRPTGAQ